MHTTLLLVKIGLVSWGSEKVLEDVRTSSVLLPSTEACSNHLIRSYGTKTKMAAQQWTPEAPWIGSFRNNCGALWGHRTRLSRAPLPNNSYLRAHCWVFRERGIYVYTYTHIDMHVSIDICVYVYIYIYIYTYEKCAYIHIYVCVYLSPGRVELPSRARCTMCTTPQEAELAGQLTAGRWPSKRP